MRGGEVVAADAVVLACGGFQGNRDIMREHFGPGGEAIPLLAPCARFNTGDGIAMARELGADAAGEWNGMHIEPVDPTRCDGLWAGGTLVPPKSNWARAISEPPFLAWPLVGAVAYTFGGLATDDRARVLRGGAPIPGLYAAGEITGHFYATAPNAVSVLRAFVFGRIAGREAVLEAVAAALPRRA